MDIEKIKKMGEEINELEFLYCICHLIMVLVEGDIDKALSVVEKVPHPDAQELVRALRACLPQLKSLKEVAISVADDGERSNS